MRAMKDSGIEWIGEIPESWDVGKLGYFIQVFNGDRSSNYPSGNDLQEEGIPFLTSSNLEKDELTLDECKYITQEKYDSMGGFKMQINDIIYCLRGSVGKCSINLTEIQGTVASSLMGIRCIKIDPKFLLYILKSSVIETQNALFMNGTCAANLSAENVAEYRIPISDSQTQVDIVDYLDKKCAEIDALIAAKERTNALLRERRQSIIYEAVTKGLNPDAPMKDSGIEWIGHIPEDWDAQKIKYCFKVYAGATPKSGNSEFWDGDIVWVTPADYTTEQKYISVGRKNITQEGFESCSTELIPAGSLIFSKRAPIGLVAINTVDMCTNQGCLSCVPCDENDVEYFYYAFSCFTEQFDLYGSGTTFKEISADAFMNFIIPYPAPEVQRQISDYLRGKCAEMDTLISANEATIQKLKEYRQSIIYEAVTGKIEI